MSWMTSFVPSTIKTMIFVSLLGCSADFDLVGHSILSNHLGHRLGVSGKPLGWFQSYLCDRTQCVSIKRKTTPSPTTLLVEYHRALFSAKPVYYVYQAFWWYNLQTCCQFWSVCRWQPTLPGLWQVYLSSHLQRLFILEAVTVNIWQWMPLNGLKLNDNKIEFMLIQFKHAFQIPPLNISHGSDVIAPS